MGSALYFVRGVEMRLEINTIVSRRFKYPIWYNVHVILSRVVLEVGELLQEKSLEKNQTRETSFLPFAHGIQTSTSPPW